MENIVSFLKDWGAVVGCVSTTIALVTLIVKNARSKTDKHITEVAQVEESREIHHQINERIDLLEKQFQEYIKRDEEFKKNIQCHLETQRNVDKKLLANIIENLYYQNKDKQRLDMNEFKRLTEVYSIYSGDELHGNSYIAAIYEIMMTWDRE